MSKRADDVAETRQRIVDAAVHLHGTIGLAATTISALAEEAGVTRLTVYRHFPDDDTLVAACSQHWYAAQALPDLAAWQAIADPEQRVSTGLTDLYRFYRDGQAMLTNIHHDFGLLPAAIQEQLVGADATYRDALLEPFRARGTRRALLRAVLAHAVSFGTWRSLCVDNELTNDQAVHIMIALTRTIDPKRRTPQQV